MRCHEDEVAFVLPGRDDDLLVRQAAGSHDALAAHACRLRPLRDLVDDALSTRPRFLEKTLPERGGAGRQQSVVGERAELGHDMYRGHAGFETLRESEAALDPLVGKR